MRRSSLLLFLVTTTACTHDFDAFLESGDAAPTVDSGVGADTATASDSASTDSASTDSTPADEGTDAAGGCTDPGAKTLAGHCYFVLATAVHWTQGRDACAAANAHLVSVASAEEEALIESFLPAADRWIGLSRPVGSPSVDASFTWIDGTPTTFKDWSSGEPNGSGECVRVHSAKQWGDSTCNTNYPTVCERDTGG